MTTLHVMLNKETDTPLETIFATGVSGTWRVSDKTMEPITEISIWDKGSERKLVARITGWNQTSEGKVIEFDPANATVTETTLTSRPRFNRIGFAVT